MSIIERDVRPEISRMKDHELIEQSAAQIDTRLALPEDFIILQPGEAEVPSHGQQGKTAAERRKLMQKAADAPGKSKLSI